MLRVRSNRDWRARIGGPIDGAVQSANRLIGVEGQTNFLLDGFGIIGARNSHDLAPAEKPVERKL